MQLRRNFLFFILAGLLSAGLLPRCSCFVDILDRVLLTGAPAAHTFKQQWFAGRDHYWSCQSKSKTSWSAPWFARSKSSEGWREEGGHLGEWTRACKWRRVAHITDQEEVVAGEAAAQVAQVLQRYVLPLSQLQTAQFQPTITNTKASTVGSRRAKSVMGDVLEGVEDDSRINWFRETACSVLK